MKTLRLHVVQSRSDPKQPACIVFSQVQSVTKIVRDEILDAARGGGVPDPVLLFTGPVAVGNLTSVSAIDLQLLTAYRLDAIDLNQPFMPGALPVAATSQPHDSILRRTG